MAPQPKPLPSPPQQPRAIPAGELFCLSVRPFFPLHVNLTAANVHARTDGNLPRSGRSFTSGKSPPKTQEQRNTPELMSAAFGHIIPRDNNGISSKRTLEPPVKLPSVPGASPREIGRTAAGIEECASEGQHTFESGDLTQQAEQPPARRVTGELLAPWQVRLRRKRLAEVAAAARADEGAESAAAVAAREAQRRWVPASAVDALPDPRLEARVSATDHVAKSTVVDTLVLQNGVLGATAFNGESNAMRALKAGKLKRAKRRKARARAEEQREAQRESQEAALSRLTDNAAY